MKRLIIIIIAIISIALARHTYEEKSRESNYINLIGLNVPKESELIEFRDSHGGFHGDGELFEVVQLEQKDVNIFVRDALDTGSWGRLPMGKDLTKFIYGEYTRDYSFGGYGEMMPDDIVNGLYYFKDRNSRGGYIFDRFSQNFNFAMFDINEGILYILKYDS